MKALALGLALLAAAAAPSPALEMVRIPGGRFTPLYGGDANGREVAPFLLDARAVTHAEFARFVEAKPEWRRSQVAPLFAEPGYLGRWSGDLEPSPAGGPDGRSPVTEVSWFAARAYCAWRDKRLPRLDEWELAARADETLSDASGSPEFRARILEWYARPTPALLPPVGEGYRNVFGAYELHGLVWEWVSDWNSLLITGESRADSEIDQDLYCASSSAASRDPGDYAAFLRYSMRASLRAEYAVRNVGFRCARDVERLDAGS